MQGFFNRMYNGKSNQPDFTPEGLPGNRFQLFFEMLRLHVGQLVLLNLLNLLFLIPWMFWTWLNFAAMETSPDQVAGFIQNWLLLSPIALLPYAPCAAATAYLTRNWARDEHTWLTSDFFSNYKSNWKQSVGMALVFGLLANVMYVAARFYAELAAQNVLFTMLQVLLLIFAALAALSLMLVFPIIAGYRLKFKEVIQSAFSLVAVKIYFAIPIGLVVALPVLLLAIPNVYTYIAAFVYFFIIGIGMGALVSASYANYLFDSYVNPRIEGAPMRKGLRPSDEELDAEFEDEDEDDGDEEEAKEPEESERARMPGNPKPATNH